MNGCWIPDTPIAVDYWKRQTCPATVFFLSHMHADHTSGLSSSWKDKIYCSEITAKLLESKFGIKNKLIWPLTMGTSHIVDLDVINCITMTVTLIDAHHCPGAVMFLFEGYFGTILYTGDFRFCSEMSADLGVISGKCIDTLYFDNTYNSPEFCFPPREDAREQIFQIISDHKDSVVVIGMFNLGKENLLIDIAKYFETRIVVSPEKMFQINLLDLPDVFTTGVSTGWIRVEKKMKITNSNIEKWNKEKSAIAILPTALFSSSQNYRNSRKIYTVPYSDHSSYLELLQFVARVKPKRLIPIVKKNEFYSKMNITDIQHFNDFLDKNPQKSVIVPDVFQNYFISSGSKVVRPKNYNLKRNRSLGVQFHDSPEKVKIPPKQLQFKNQDELTTRKKE
ncbi:5' exonuclease Apollo-like, partial [Antedon mediterranea]|uniref:5' exonuclease Apollo-like n=1 Tax=Antedon mediterranea TaxID=105859 RepID=UPI003AF64708